MGAAAHLLLGLAAVVVSAWLFTNGLEWFGAKSRVPHGALGSVFAAMGTALPEASIAILAAIAPGPGSTKELGDAVSIGAVLGAPLLLATLGFAVLGLGGLRARRAALRVPTSGVRRDLLFFFGTFGASAALGAVGVAAGVRLALAPLLVAAYCLFVFQTLTTSGGAVRPPRPRRLAFAFGARAGAVPPWPPVVLQMLVALGIMFLGAQAFVHTLTAISTELGLSGFALAALIAPLATELPETANSLVWIAQDKDALATGNVTGALVLQGAVIPAVGMTLTPWRFNALEELAAALALAGGALVYVDVLWRRRLRPWVLVSTAALYLGFVLWLL